MNATELIPADIRLVETCGACPEQYDAFDPSGKLVGYLRLRHGEFTVNHPECGGTLILSGCTVGDGCFDPDEREPWLLLARTALAHRINMESRHAGCSTGQSGVHS